MNTNLLPEGAEKLHKVPQYSVNHSWLMVDCCFKMIKRSGRCGVGGNMRNVWHRRREWFDKKNATFIPCAALLLWNKITFVISLFCKCIQGFGESFFTVLYWNTGSSRKNDKSNPVFRGTNCNKSSVFSAVLDQELAANLSFRAPRSITITRWHP